MGPIRFEWDERKNAENKRKHRVSFEEARTVFLDDHARLIADPDHSDLRSDCDMSKLDHPRPDGLLHSESFSQVVVASGTRTVYTAGQVSIDESGALVGAGDLAKQTAQIMRNLGLALAAAGATYADIVKITTYVVDYRPEHRAVIGLARAPFFSKGPPPASTLVGVSALALPEWLVEIEAIAVIG